MPVAGRRATALLLLLMSVAAMNIMDSRAIVVPPASRNLYQVDAAAMKAASHDIPPTVRRGVFPADFVFGASTSAYQVEGGWLEGGKGFSIWDVTVHIPGQIADGNTGDIANDFYHKYDADLAMMAAAGIKHFRMSISWPRILPDGTLGTAGPSKEGIAFYNRVFDACASYGITPHVTLFHSDVPAALVQYPRPGIAFLADDFPALFSTYADVVFAAFGSRIKNWFTFNEPWCSAVLGVDGGSDPYTIAHNILRAHAVSVHLYRSKYQSSQKGRISIVLNTAHFFPADASSALDIAAAERTYAFNLGWFLDPIFFGDYPGIMREVVGSRLPRWSNQTELQWLRESLDAISLNHYTSFLCKPGSVKPGQNNNYWLDTNTSCFYDPSWPLTDVGWAVVPVGIQELLLYVAGRYESLPIFVTENGMAGIGEADKAVALNDTMRQRFVVDYVENVGLALQKGAPARGYFHWSIIDNLEWGSGFTKHFGMVWVDREDPELTRYPKGSLATYANIIRAAAFAAAAGTTSRTSNQAQVLVGGRA